MNPRSASRSHPSGFPLSLRLCVISICGLAAAILALSLGTDASSATGPVCTSNQQQGVLCLTVTDTPDPVSYSSFDGNQTYLLYEATLSNDSRSSNLSHVGLTETLPAGTGFVSATSSTGSCSQSGGVVTCALGQFAAGASATVEVVVTAPETSDANPPDQTITNAVTASFDERFSDQSGGKQDTASVNETTLVSATAGQTYVPEGFSGKVDTDPGQEQYANATLPDVTSDVLATIQLLDPDSFCSSGGTVRIGKKNYICRDGAFVDVSVVNNDTGAKYSNTHSPLVFHLKWGPDLVSSKQTVRNFVVFYQSSATSPLQAIKTRCNAGATNLPCLRNIVLLADGGAEADLVKADNGHMR